MTPCLEVARECEGHLVRASQARAGSGSAVVSSSGRGRRGGTDVTSNPSKGSMRRGDTLGSSSGSKAGWGSQGARWAPRGTKKAEIRQSVLDRLAEVSRGHIRVNSADLRPQPPKRRRPRGAAERQSWAGTSVFDITGPPFKLTPRDMSFSDDEQRSHAKVPRARFVPPWAARASSSSLGSARAPKRKDSLASPASSSSSLWKGTARNSPTLQASLNPVFLRSNSLSQGIDKAAHKGKTRGAPKTDSGGNRSFGGSGESPIARSQSGDSFTIQSLKLGLSWLKSSSGERHTSGAQGKGRAHKRAFPVLDLAALPEVEESEFRNLSDSSPESAAQPFSETATKKMAGRKGLGATQGGRQALVGSGMQRGGGGERRGGGGRVGRRGRGGMMSAGDRNSRGERSGVGVSGGESAELSLTEPMSVSRTSGHGRADLQSLAPFTELERERSEVQALARALAEVSHGVGREEALGESEEDEGGEEEEEEEGQEEEEEVGEDEESDVDSSGGISRKEMLQILSGVSPRGQPPWPVAYVGLSSPSLSPRTEGPLFPLERDITFGSREKVRPQLVAGLSVAGKVDMVSAGSGRADRGPLPADREQRLMRGAESEPHITDCPRSQSARQPRAEDPKQRKSASQKVAGEAASGPVIPALGWDQAVGGGTSTAPHAASGPSPQSLVAGEELGEQNPLLRGPAVLKGSSRKAGPKRQGTVPNAVDGAQAAAGNHEWAKTQVAMERLRLESVHVSDCEPREPGQRSTEDKGVGDESTEQVLEGDTLGGGESKEDVSGDGRRVRDLGFPEEDVEDLRRELHNVKREREELTQQLKAAKKENLTQRQQFEEALGEQRALVDSLTAHVALLMGENREKRRDRPLDKDGTPIGAPLEELLHENVKLRGAVERAQREDVKRKRLDVEQVRRLEELVMALHKEVEELKRRRAQDPPWDLASGDGIPTKENAEQKMSVVLDQADVVSKEVDALKAELQVLKLRVKEEVDGRNKAESNVRRMVGSTPAHGSVRLKERGGLVSGLVVKGSRGQDEAAWDLNSQLEGKEDSMDVEAQLREAMHKQERLEGRLKEAGELNVALAAHANMLERIVATTRNL